MLAHLGLGSNVGDRLGNLQAAVNFLDLRAGDVVAVSSVYETEPMYVLDQPSFYNAVVTIETSLEPEALLECAKAIEKEVGRIGRDRHGPREIDIDVLALEDGAAFVSESLTLPHPSLAERRFVLEPLAEVAPNLVLNGHDMEKLLGSVRHQKVTNVPNATLSVHRD